jgi:heat-inducible transcriptional repressor
VVLTQRQRLILNAVVEDYVQSAEPVGSRTLSKHGEIQFSAATIRNEMADLEDMGYLDHIHTSSGRIPSQKGYRFYVDNLLQRQEIVSGELDALRSMFQQRIHEVERIISQTSTVLSHLTNQVTIVLGPKIQQERVKKIELIPITKGRAVAILVTDTGHVQDRQVQLSDDIAVEDIAAIVRLLNDKLAGVPLSKVKSRFYREVVVEMAAMLEHYEDFLGVIEELSSVAETAEKVYVGGAANILAQPEFRDIDKVRPLLILLESAELANQVLPETYSGLDIRIGEENTAEPLRDCTVISTTYSMPGMAIGRIGIVGPTRMDYARIIQILDYTSRSLTKILTGWTDAG